MKATRLWRVAPLCEYGNEASVSHNQRVTAGRILAKGLDKAVAGFNVL